MARVCLTFHDLPVWPHWTSEHGHSTEVALSKVLAAFEKHGISDVYCLANSGTGLVKDGHVTTTLPYNATFRSLLDKWVAAGNHIANHTHSHAAAYQVGVDALKDDIARADRELGPWISKAPTKMFCFCTDHQGDTEAEAKELAAYVADLGYTQLPAASMVFEWRFDLAYLGALARGDVELASRIRAAFVDFSVKQTLFDHKRGCRLFGPGFIPTLLLHNLTIVADAVDDWVAGHLAAGCIFVAAEEALESCDLYRALEGLADPEHIARAALMKVGRARGEDWPESAPEQAEVMKWIRELEKETRDKGLVQVKEHLIH